MNTWDRRDFLKMLAALPVLFVLDCRKAGTIPADVALLGPDESLRKLIRLLGPWQNRVQAEDFIGRFLASDASIAPYLPDRGASLQRLAARFPGDRPVLDSVDLGPIPPEERALLLELSRQLYTFVEVRFLVSGEPPWGLCGPDDPLRYTREPA